MALTFKSIDTMKASRDANPALSNANIVAHVNALNTYVPDATHFTVASYQNNFSFYSISKINEWFDAVHAVGKKVFFRPALATFSPNTVEGLTDVLVESVHNFNWQDGDAWDVIPESSDTSALYNTYYGLGNPASWNAFVRDTVTTLNAEFASINKNVDCTFWSRTDQGVIFGTRVEQDTVTATGKICIDFYPMDVGSLRAKIQSCIGQITRAHANYPTADIYVTEIGYNNTTLVGDEDQRNVLRHFFNELSNLSYVKGLNYWHASGDTAFDKCLLFQDDSLTLPRPALFTLGEFYSSDICNNRVKII